MVAGNTLLANRSDRSGIVGIYPGVWVQVTGHAVQMDDYLSSLKVPQTTSFQPAPPDISGLNIKDGDANGSWISNAKALMSSFHASSSASRAPARPPFAPPPPPERNVGTGTFSKRKISKERPKVQSITFERYNMSKPALMEEMKTHIDKGLHSIESDLSDKNISDEIDIRLRTLNVYREAFQKFIDECNIYRPVLSSIKHEYEKTLEFYNSNFNSVISLHAELAAKNVEFTNEKKLINEEYAEYMNTLVDQRLMAQRAFNHSKKEQTRIVADHEQMQTMYAKMKSELEEAQGSIASMSVALTRAESERVEALQLKSDVETELSEMKIALSKFQDKNDKLVHSVQDLESIQSQMVSLDVVMSYMETIKKNRREYKQLETNHKAMIQRYTDIKFALQHSFEKYASTISEDGQNQINASMMGNSGTQIDVNEIKENPVLMVEKMTDMSVNPRVIIESLLDCIENLRENGGGGGKASSGMGRGNMRMGLSGLDRSTMEEDKITPEDRAFVSPWTHFEGLGLDPSLPPYLRANGYVQNIMLSKRDTEMIINDIWVAREKLVEEAEAKAAVDRKPINLKPFDDFFYEYISNRFKWGNRIVEFGYNFIDALKKYVRDSDIRLFSLVLNGRLNEEVRNDSIQMMVNFEEELKKEEMMSRSDISGVLTFDVFMRVLRRIFPTKGDVPLQRLERVLLFETNGTKTVKYIELLGEDENGNQGKFAELLRAQHLTEIEQFTDHVMDCIDQRGDGQECIVVNRLREALETADPNKSRPEINRLLSRGMDLPVEDVLMSEARATLVNVNNFKTKLKIGLLKKSPPVS